jgi:hypothetical protein
MSAPDTDGGAAGVGAEAAFGACPLVAVLLVLLTATPRRYGLPVDYVGAIGVESPRSREEDR